MSEQLVFEFLRKPTVIAFYKRSVRSRNGYLYHVESTDILLQCYRVRGRSDAHSIARVLAYRMDLGTGSVYIWYSRDKGLGERNMPRN